MFRPASRLIARPTAVRAVSRSVAPATRRLLSTAPPTEKRRSWKSLVARLGIAGAIVYYYNTTDVFAEEPRRSLQTLPETENESEQLPTLEAVAEERRRRKAEAEAAAARAKAAAEAAEKTQAQNSREDTTTPSDPQALEEEADQQGAFNPETGEINWDCPCLGGMAHGPCGEEFKAAFSCFVYSTEEPKGMECVEKFKDMQNCFRQYPEIYGSELDTDEELDENAMADRPQTDASESSSPNDSGRPAENKSTREQRAQSATEQVEQDHGDAEKHYIGSAVEPKSEKSQSRSDNASVKEHAKSAAGHVKKGIYDAVSEEEEVVPKAAFDATAANGEKKTEKR